MTIAEVHKAKNEGLKGKYKLGCQGHVGSEESEEIVWAGWYTGSVGRPGYPTDREEPPGD